MLFEHDLFRKPVPTFRDHAPCAPARQQRQRVVALDLAQIVLAEAELASALDVFPAEAERKIGAPQDLRDRHHPGQRRERHRVRDLRHVVVEALQLGHHAVRHVRLRSAGSGRRGRGARTGTARAAAMREDPA